MKYTITNIRQGKNEYSEKIYADLYDETGNLITMATLDYITIRLRALLKKEGESK